MEINLQMCVRISSEYLQIIYFLSKLDNDMISSSHHIVIDGECGASYISCYSTDVCISDSATCDENPACINGDDEINCGM